MHENGYVIVPNILTDKECKELKGNYNNSALYRKIVSMERYRFGLGEYKYFNYRLTLLIQSIRENIYPKLAPIANEWMKVLNIATVFPDTHQELLKQCFENNQRKATVLILKIRRRRIQYIAPGFVWRCIFPHANRLVLK